MTNISRVPDIWPSHFSRSCDLISYDGYIFHDYVVYFTCSSFAKITFSELIKKKRQQFLTSDCGFKFMSETLIQHCTILLLYYYFNYFNCICIETAKLLFSLKVLLKIFNYSFSQIKITLKNEIKKEHWKCWW